METAMNRPNPISRILRNKNFLYNVIAVVAFAAVAWIYFYPDAVQGNVLKQHDVQQGIAIGQEVKAFTENTGETSRWTNSLFSGMPNFQISPSYESSKLISWVSTAYSLGFPSPVNILFIMMLGFYILLKAFKVKWYIAIPGAIAYAFSTYFCILIGAGHIWKYITLAYIPPTIAGIVWCYRGKFIAGGAVAAFFAMLQIASNHVQMSYYFLFLIFALVLAYLFNSIKKNEIKKWATATGILLLAGTLAILANSPNLYNTYEYSKETMRGGHSELSSKETDNNASTNGLDKSYITAWSYGIDETASLLIPNIKGGASIKPEKGTNRQLTLADTDIAIEMYKNGEISATDSQILMQIPQYFGDQPMTNGPVYVGALILALFLIGCFTVKGAVKWAILAATVLSIFLSWGHNFMSLTDIFIDYFPLYNKFRTVSSILVIAEFTIPLLAILALQQMLTEKDFFRKNANYVYGSFAFLIIISLFAWIMPNFFGSPYSQYETEQLINSGVLSQYPTAAIAIEAVRYKMISADAIRSCIFLILGLVTLLCFSKQLIKPLTTCGIITVIVLFDLIPVNKRYLNHDSFSEVSITEQASTKISPRNVDLQILKDTTMNYRVLDINRFGEASPSYFHKMIGGYHAAKLTRYQDLIEHQISKNNIAVLNMLNTKYIIIDDNTAEINPEALGNGWFVNNIEYVNSPQEEMNAITAFNPLELAVADKKFKEILGLKAPQKEIGDTIIETSYAPNKLTYKAISKNGGVAVFSEIYFPWGWKATIDGKDVEIGRVNYVLRALRVPAGEHQISFSFDPESVKTTETMAYIAIILIYLSMIISLIRAKKD